MRSDLTDITVVMDRSGSMNVCLTDAEGGLNHFLDEQKKQPGEALFTLVQFDHEYEFVHRGVPIRTVPYCTLVPRGNTALLDAVGRAIVETGERLSKMNEADRPALVVVVIITDGEENASKEFNRTKIKEMISHQQTAYNWQFTYLGANQDAFAEAGSLGIQGSIAPTTNQTQRAAWGSTSAKMSRMRDDSSSHRKVQNEYTESELREMKGSDEK